jgi:hypothetical protein
MPYKNINRSHPTLFLADGRRAERLRLPELRKLVVPPPPGVKATDGKDVWLERMGEQQLAKARALYPDRKLSYPLPEDVAREAAAALIAEARA